MEDENDIVSLNLIVQNIDFDNQSSSMSKFMISLFKQECKDFRLVFIANLYDQQNRKMIQYVDKFSKTIGFDNMLIVNSDKDIPKAKFTKYINDLSECLDIECEIKNIIEKLKYKNNNENNNKNNNKNNKNNNENNKNNKNNIINDNISDNINYSINTNNSINSCNSTKIKITKDNLIQQNNRKLKIVCYTCITGKYDSLKQPLKISNNIDFICFVDDVNQYPNAGIWKIRKIPDELQNLSNIKKQRAIKICPHKYFLDYDISIWIDGSIQVKEDLNDFIKIYDLSDIPLYVRKHPERSCIYDEAIKCIEMKKDSKVTIDKWIKKLQNEKYPKKYSLAETGILLRKHTDKICQRICNEWWNYVLNNSYRDQLSFNYVCWKEKFLYGILDKNPNILNDNDKYFNLISNHKKHAKLDSSYVTIAICNFNTTKLTNDCIKSIIKYVKSFKFKIIVLDNSDQQKFILDNDINVNSVSIIDNTDGKYLNFNSMIATCFSHKSHNNHASAKHCYSIQYLINICTTKYMILFDSDTIVKHDIDFISDDMITVSDTQSRKIDFRKKQYVIRFLPFIQLFNIEMIIEKSIKYFDSKRIGENQYHNKIYDTGSSFYEDVINNKLKWKKIDFNKYITHLNAGSWASYKPFQCIVSFTTFGPRMKNLIRTCQLILQQKTSIDFKICITLDKDDISKLTSEQQNFIRKNNIEILTGDNRLRPHNKYFFVMQKYKKIPIITIDDDIKYDNDLIYRLYLSYIKFPNCVSAYRTHLMTYNKDIVKRYKDWIFDYRKELKPSKYLFATGVGGILYPPDILKISNDDMKMIDESILADDVFLKKKELLLNINVVYVPHSTKLNAYVESFDNVALSKNGQNFTTNDIIIKKLNLNK